MPNLEHLAGGPHIFCFTHEIRSNVFLRCLMPIFNRDSKRHIGKCFDIENLANCFRYRIERFFATLSVCTSNHMFRRAILDKLPECIIENFLKFKNEGNFKIFKNHNSDLSQKSPEPNMFTTPNQQTLCIETNIF